MSLVVGDAERQSTWDSIRGLWEQRRLCDVVLESRDGGSLEAHRLVLAAASPALCALVDGRFAESQGGPIKFDVAHATLIAMVRYLYEIDVVLQPDDDALELLHLAHLYGLHKLQQKVVASLSENLNLDSATAVLVRIETMGLFELQQQCEAYIATHFQACCKSDAFLQLSASQIGRLLRNRSLSVSCEEVVLQSLLKWNAAATDRYPLTRLLLQHVQFPLLSMRALEVVEAYAQNAGPIGLDLEIEAKRGLKIHHGNDPLDDGEPHAKRRCFNHWWSDWGASLLGGTQVFGDAKELVLSFPRSIALYKDSLFIADRGNKRVLRWQFSASAWDIVAGQGADVNGINDLGDWFSITVSSSGELFVADRNHDRVLRFGDAGGELVGHGRWRQPTDIAITRDRSIFVLDDDGQKVQKLDGDRVVTVAGGNGVGPAADQFRGSFGGMFVTDSGIVYICDYKQHRVQRWLPGAREGTTVAGGNGQGSMMHQLHAPNGIFVLSNGDMYVSDCGNSRIVKWRASASSGVVVAGGCGEGDQPHQLRSPASLVRDESGVLFICEHRAHRISKWGPAPTFAL